MMKTLAALLPPMTENLIRAWDLYAQGRDNPRTTIINYEPYKSIGITIANQIYQYTDNETAIISGLLYDTFYRTKMDVTASLKDFDKQLKFEISVQTPYYNYLSSPRDSEKTRLANELKAKWKWHMTELRALVQCVILKEQYAFMVNHYMKTQYAEACANYCNWFTKKGYYSKAHKDLIEKTNAYIRYRDQIPQ